MIELYDPSVPLEPASSPRPLSVVIHGLLDRWRLSMLTNAYRVIGKPRLRPPKQH